VADNNDRSEFVTPVFLSVSRCLSEYFRDLGVEKRRAGAARNRAVPASRLS